VSCYLLSLDERAYDTADTSQNPEEVLQETEERQRLREAIAQLPEKNRQVLEGYYFQELSLEEIGQKLGLSKSWVCRVHAKSLELVRTLLTAEPAPAQ
jgi:RNA polymerase sigma factor for flagellar operon FliA